MKPTLPVEDSMVTAVCGCTGLVLSLHGGGVHVRILDPCPGPDHPSTPPTATVIEHFLPEEIQPPTVQLVIDLSPTPGMEKAAA